MNRDQALLQDTEAQLEALRAQLDAVETECILLRAVIDAIPFYAYTKDTDCRFVYLNKAHRQQLLGVQTNEEVRGKSDLDFFPPEQAHQYQADERELLASGKGRVDYEEVSTSPDGGERWHRSTKLPVYRADGELVGLFGITFDITDEKLAAVTQRQQEAVIAAQQETLLELSTPVIPILDHIIIMPLIGAIDTLRARNIMRALLGAISEHKAQVVMIDITGVPLVDTGVASHLNHTIQAARLKGAHTIVCGISDAVAETIVDLGIDWSDIETVANLRTGLMVALKRLNMQLEK
jgi:rsbT co-antagonist protein RsbR